MYLIRSPGCARHCHSIPLPSFFQLLSPTLAIQRQTRNCSPCHCVPWPLRFLLVSPCCQNATTHAVCSSSAAALSRSSDTFSFSDPTAGLQYPGVFFATVGLFPAAAPIFTWISSDVSGQNKRCTATAFQISLGDIGAVIGCQMYRLQFHGISSVVVWHWVLWSCRSQHRCYGTC